MKTISQTAISERAGVHVSTVGNIVCGRRRPSWRVAKRLAEVTGTSPELWLEGKPEEIRAAIGEIRDR